MRQVVIIGNAGAARECYWLLQDVFAADASMRNNHIFKGFLSWKGYSGDLRELAPLQFGDAPHYTVQPDEELVIGIGDVKLRSEVFATLKAHGAQFMNLVHPLAGICPTAVVGEGNILHRGSSVYCNAHVGNANYLNGYVNVAHDAVLGDCKFLAPGSMVLGGAQTGSRNRLGPGCIVLDCARIGDDNLLAPGAIVYKGCGNNCRMAGNPALKIGEVV